MLLRDPAVLGKALWHICAVGLERASQKLASDGGSSPESRASLTPVRKGVPLVNLGLSRSTEFGTKTALQNNPISSR